MAEKASPKASMMLPSLTGIRVIGAIVVFCSHVLVSQYFASPSANSVENALFGQAAMSVSLFFILSGFVLTWTWRERDTPQLFWRRRAVKLWPNHIVTWAIMLGVITGAGALATVGIPTVIQNLFLLQAWSPNIQTFFSMNMPAWSLSCEIFFYLLFPFLLRGIRKIDPSKLYAVAGVLVLIIFSFPVIAMSTLGGETLPHFPAPITQLWFVQIFPVTRIFEFALGIVVARIVQSGRWVRFGMIPTTLFSLVVYVLLPHFQQLFAQVAIGVIPMALLVGEMATFDMAGKRNFLHNKWMVLLGEASFAFYMLHQIVINMVHMGVGPTKQFPTWEATLLVLLCLVVATGLSLALHKGVEMPVMRRWALPKRLRLLRDAKRAEEAAAAAKAGAPEERGDPVSVGDSAKAVGVPQMELDDPM